VIIDQINIKYIALFKSKDDPPIAGNNYGIKFFQVSGELMQAITGPTHMPNCSGRIEVRQDNFDFLYVVLVHLAAIVTLIHSP